RLQRDAVGFEIRNNILTEQILALGIIGAHKERLIEFQEIHQLVEAQVLENPSIWIETLIDMYIPHVLAPPPATMNASLHGSEKRVRQALRKHYCPAMCGESGYGGLGCVQGFRERQTYAEPGIGIV